MATIGFEAYMGAGPAWTDLGSNRLVFCGAGGNNGGTLTTTIAVTTFNDGTHAGTYPGLADSCGANHANTTKFISQLGGTGGTLSQISIHKSGTAPGADEDLTDTTLADNECALRVHFTDGVAYSIQNGRFYCFDGTTPATRATGIDMAAYEKSNSAVWQHINDDSATGPTGFTTGSIGGDNTPSGTNGRIAMGARASAATDQYWYYALSVAPETAGAKANVAVGVYLEYY